MPARDKRLQNLILLARVIFIKSNTMKFSDESRDWIKDESRGTTETKRKKVGEREKAREVGAREQKEQVPGVKRIGEECRY